MIHLTTDVLCRHQRTKILDMQKVAKTNTAYARQKTSTAIIQIAYSASRCVDKTARDNRDLSDDARKSLGYIRHTRFRQCGHTSAVMGMRSLDTKETERSDGSVVTRVGRPIEQYL